jgi:hypothetical protein
MGKIVLLAIAAAWAAVIIPPLLRSRVENRPNSSVSDFRRQLSTLQRAVPTRTMVPIRSMGRPLTQSPARPAGQQRMHGASLDRRSTVMERDDAPAPRRQSGHGQMRVQRVSHREVVRRRRANVLFILVAGTAATAFLAATTKSHAMVYAFALAFVSLCGYCYRLVQLRNYELDRRYSEANWFNAA